MRTGGSPTPRSEDIELTEQARRVQEMWWSSSVVGSSGRIRKESSLAVESLERMQATVLEHQTRRLSKDTNRFRHKDLVRSCSGHNACGLVHSDAPHARADQLHLTDMNTRSYLEIEVHRITNYGRRALERSGWTLESGEYTVSRGFDLATTEPFKFAANRLVVLGEQVLPRDIP